MTSESPECREISFWGLKVPPQKSVQQEVVYDDTTMEMYHITNIALGENPKSGLNTLKINYDGTEFVLATLDKDKGVYQLALDTVLEKTAAFVNTGSTPIFLSGYKTVSTLDDADYDDDYSGEEEDEDDDDEPPAGVPLGNGMVSGGRMQQRTVLHMQVPDLISPHACR